MWGVQPQGKGGCDISYMGGGEFGRGNTPSKISTTSDPILHYPTYHAWLPSLATIVDFQEGSAVDFQG